MHYFKIKEVCCECAYIVKDIMHYCHISVDKYTRIAKFVIPYYDLTFVLKGSMSYVANNREYVLKENNAILLPPGTARQRLEGTQRVQYVSFNFQICEDGELPVPPFLKNVITQDIRKLIGVFSQSHLSPLYHSKQKLHNVLNYILFVLYRRF